MKSLKSKPRTIKTTSLSQNYVSEPWEVLASYIFFALLPKDNLLSVEVVIILVVVGSRASVVTTASVIVGGASVVVGGASVVVVGASVVVGGASVVVGGASVVVMISVVVGVASVVVMVVHIKSLFITSKDSHPQETFPREHVMVTLSGNGNASESPEFAVETGQLSSSTSAPIHIGKRN